MGFQWRQLSQGASPILPAFPVWGSGSLLLTKRYSNLGRNVMGRLLKIGVLLTVVFAGLTLLTLRLTGFDPPYLDARSEEFSERLRTWLSIQPHAATNFTLAAANRISGWNENFLTLRGGGQILSAIHACA